MRPLSPSVVPIILCGGGGERLWPLSRASLPKHLVRLRGRPSLLEQTVERLACTFPSAGSVVLCNASEIFGLESA